MTDYEITLLNQMIEACIDCGGDPGGPYYTNVTATENAIRTFIHAVDPTLDVVFGPDYARFGDVFKVYRKEEK